MTFTRTVTMLALARESLERFDNDADAAQGYLLDRLVNDTELREALVKSAIEYERREMEAPSSQSRLARSRFRCISGNSLSRAGSALNLSHAAPNCRMQCLRSLPLPSPSPRSWAQCC